MGVPLSSWDLREIAKTLDSVKRKFGESYDDTETAFGKSFYQIDLEVLRPDTDEPIGRIKYYDGFLGFYPDKIEED